MANVENLKETVQQTRNQSATGALNLQKTGALEQTQTWKMNEYLSSVPGTIRYSIEIVLWASSATVCNIHFSETHHNIQFALFNL